MIERGWKYHTAIKFIGVFLYLNKHPQIVSVITKRKKKRIFNLEPEEIS